MLKIAVLHLGAGDESRVVRFLGQEIEIRRIGCKGDAEEARAIIAQLDGQVDAVGLNGMPQHLRLGSVERPHEAGQTLPEAAEQTPVVDGSGIRAGLERWGVILADRAQPGIFSHKRILMAPGLNHNGLATGLGRHSIHIRYADPVIYFALPQLVGVGRKETLQQAAGPTLEQLKDAPFRRLMPEAGTPARPRDAAGFEWADVIAGDIGAIRRYAPDELKRKTIVVNHATEEDAADLAARGADILITTLPSLSGSDLAGYSAAAIEAALVALRPDSETPLTEDTYLDLMADIQWTPGIRYLQQETAGINRFAFVIHPLDLRFVHADPRFRWTRYLPDRLVEACAAYFPPIYLSRIKGGKSPTTGQKIEGHLITLGATPREMLRHDAAFTYRKLNQCARIAERKGARIMGLGAFTSVVGDAGVTVANEADIAITSGNSLTVAATLESAKQAVMMMGATDLTKGRAMVVGATGSIGSVCARLLAQAIFDVVLVSIEPERLIEMKRKIQAETPGAHVAIATKADDYLASCDLVVTATSAFGQRIIDITKCKPGAVICDVARPPDIGPEEAKLRPDVLVIESGEVLIPGDIDFGYDIGLPPKTAYACLAETALLAMEGRFEDYTVGRNITMERVKEIYRLFKKHEFKLAGLRSHGHFVTEDWVKDKRRLADKYREDPALFERVQREAASKLATMPVMAKGVRASDRLSLREQVEDGVRWVREKAGRLIKR